MSLIDAIHVAGSGAKAQASRLQLSASNLANANTVASSSAEAYKAKHAVFETMVNSSSALNSKVAVTGVVHSNAPIEKEYAPDHPLADKDGFIFHSNVNRMVELADVMTSTDSYQANIEMLGSLKKLMQQTMQIIGKI